MLFTVCVKAVICVCKFKTAFHISSNGLPFGFAGGVTIAATGITIMAIKTIAIQTMIIFFPIFYHPFTQTSSSAVAPAPSSQESENWNPDKLSL
jgi:hypothetical protein